MDDLYAKFLPQFVKLARERVSAAIGVATGCDQAAAMTTVRGLHTLAGEAGLLGLADVVPLARDCEQKAKALHGSSTAANSEALVSALRQLERVIDSIAATMPAMPA
jgi:HPt (histidine-containing phosphotransfer) domain-containing protein